MRVDILTKEYPPAIYGGAGVHVAELVRALRGLADLDVQVQAFGAPRDEPGVTAYADLPELGAANAALQTIGVDLAIAGGCEGTDLVHSHTWYANLGGHLAGLLYDVPHVVTAHSLEPLRPWKAEQLGGGYALSSFAERTSYLGAAAVIAVSAAMRDDVLHAYPDVDPGKVHVVHNGIDTEGWSRVDDPDRVRRQGVDPGQPSVVFVGRITRQKGLPLFLRACRELPPDVQLVLCAGAPDTPEILAEVEGLVAELAADPRGRGLDPRDAPAGRRGRPAVGRDGVRLPVDLRAARHRQPRGDGVRDRGRRDRHRRHPRGRRARRDRACWCRSSRPPTAPARRSNPEQYVADFAEALISVVSDPDRAAEMGRAGRRRAIESFSWDAIAEQTKAIYDSLV